MLSPANHSATQPSQIVVGDLEPGPWGLPRFRYTFERFDAPLCGFRPTRTSLRVTPPGQTLIVDPVKCCQLQELPNFYP